MNINDTVYFITKHRDQVLKGVLKGFTKKGLCIVSLEKKYVGTRRLVVRADRLTTTKPIKLIKKLEIIDKKQDKILIEMNNILYLMKSNHATQTEIERFKTLDEELKKLNRM